MIGKLQEEHTKIDLKIVNELIELTPEWWTKIQLELTVLRIKGTVQIKHHLVSPEEHKDIVALSDELHAFSFELLNVFEKHGKPFKKILYQISKENGDWDYVIDYKY